MRDKHPVAQLLEKYKPTAEELEEFRGPHPDTQIFVGFQERYPDLLSRKKGMVRYLSQEDAEIGCHLIFCHDCLEEYAALCGADEVDYNPKRDYDPDLQLPESLRQKLFGE